MCIICVELLKHRMTLDEAVRASREMILTNKDEHYKELYRALENLDLNELGEILEKDIQNI